ncbi:MAG: transcriptional regulator [Alphaproteobacteria bacterium]|nr:MAG: transcriptional regulator [Alphaproteobacteria bacterium]
MNAQLPLDQLRASAEQVSALLKTLSHPNRLLVACCLMDGERSVSDIEADTGVRQPGLSRELARLREEGLVDTRRESKVVFYRLADARLDSLMKALCAAFAPGAAPAPVAPPRPAAVGSTPSARPEDAEAPTFPTVAGRPAARLRLKPNPYRQD